MRIEGFCCFILFSNFVIRIYSKLNYLQFTLLLVAMEEDFMISISFWYLSFGNFLGRWKVSLVQFPDSHRSMVKTADDWSPCIYFYFLTDFFNNKKQNKNKNKKQSFSVGSLSTTFFRFIIHSQKLSHTVFAYQLIDFSWLNKNKILNFNSWKKVVKKVHIERCQKPNPNVFT